MRISKGEQIKQMAPFMKSAGFKKKAGTWHRQTDEGVHVVNVQGSQWGPEFYLNLGFYLRALGDEVTPPEYRCHVRSRVASPDREALLLAEEIGNWFTANGTVAALLARQQQGDLPVATTAKAVGYLVQCNHSKRGDHQV